MNRVDAIVMGRHTFDTVCAFERDWLYSKPVFVLSASLTIFLDKYEGKVMLIKGETHDIVKTLN